MKSIRDISIVGAGAMGSFYASRFFDMDASSVSLIAGGDRYDRLKREGLVVNGKPYNIPVVHPEEKASPADFIIVAVKHHHLPKAIEDMKNRVGKETIIMSVMNGIDSEERLGAVYGMEKLLYAVAVGIDALREGNAMKFTTQGKLFFGEADNRTLTDRVRRIQDLFMRADIVYETPDDMIRVLWWKFMINVGINQTSAVIRAPYGVFQTLREARALMESAMHEVTAVAAAAHINLTDEDVDNWYGVLSQLSPEGKTSMLQDVEARRKTEVEMLSGTLMEIGRRYGVPTPVNETLYRIIKVIERQ